MAAAAMKFAQQHSPLMCVRGHAQNISMSCVNKGATLVLLFALAAFYIIKCVCECMDGNPFVHANYNERGVGAESARREIESHTVDAKSQHQANERVLRPASPHANEH